MKVETVLVLEILALNLENRIFENFIDMKGLNKS